VQSFGTSRFGPWPASLHKYTAICLAKHFVHHSQTEGFPVT